MITKARFPRSQEKFTPPPPKTPRQKRQRVSCKFHLDVRQEAPELIQLVLTLLVFWSWVLLVPSFQVCLGASDGAPELAFASWPLGHLIISAAYSSPTTRARKQDAWRKFSARPNWVHALQKGVSRRYQSYRHNYTCELTDTVKFRWVSDKGKNAQYKSYKKGPTADAHPARRNKLLSTFLIQ